MRFHSFTPNASFTFGNFGVINTKSTTKTFSTPTTKCGGEKNARDIQSQKWIIYNVLIVFLLFILRSKSSFSDLVQGKLVNGYNKPLSFFLSFLSPLRLSDETTETTVKCNHFPFINENFKREEFNFFWRSQWWRWSRNTLSSSTPIRPDSFFREGSGSGSGSI